MSTEVTSRVEPECRSELRLDVLVAIGGLHSTSMCKVVFVVHYRSSCEDPGREVDGRTIVHEDEGDELSGPDVGVSGLQPHVLFRR